MAGHIIIVTKVGGAIDEDVTIIREEINPNLFREIVELANVEQITFLWPTNYGVQTQAFGNDPDGYAEFGLPGHEGIDMRAYEGTPIRAVWGGKVIANYVGKYYGNQLRIKATIRGDVYKMIYAHMKEPSKLKVGDFVKKGDYIGPADSTGNAKGSHLHFALKKVGATASGETNYPNDLIDPTNFFEILRDK